MAELASWFDTQGLTEADWYRMARRFQDDGVYGTPGDAQLQVYADSTGLNVKVRAGQAFVRGGDYTNTSDLTRTVTANGSGSPRVDRVVLRRDLTANTITPVVIAGTPAATPVAPAVQQSDTGQWDLTLAQVRVPAGAATIGPAAVDDERRYAGLRVWPVTSTTRPASASVGQPIVETDTGLFLVRNSSGGWSPPGDLEPTRSANTNVDNATSSTSWVAGANIPEITFQGSRTGRHLVHIWAALRAPSGGNTLRAGFEVRETNNAGTVVMATSTDRCISVQTGEISAGATFLLLVNPGQTYYARMMHAVTGGTGASVLARRMLITPTT